MAKNKKAVRILSVLICICIVCGIVPFQAFAVTDQTVQSERRLEKNDPIEGTDYHVTSVKDYSIAPDIQERVITTNNAAGDSQTVANVMEINPNNGVAKIVAGYGHLNPAAEGWTMATTTDQAHLYEDAYGENVVGGINASFFNITTGEPTGCMVMRGVTYKNDTSCPYIAVFSDGSIGIFKANTSLEQAAALQSEKQGENVTIIEAIAGHTMLVWDGEFYETGGGNDGYYPRSAVGIKEDGTVVFLQADGTMPPRSVGYTKEEEARMLLSLGCVAAIRLDEGGSSTYVSQREGEEDVSMRNVPAGGSERVVSETILVVSTAPSTGEFDHASITPNSEYFTPNSSVALQATGMDYSGSLADAIPGDATWSFAAGSENMGQLIPGAIDGNTCSATFVSNGTVGDAVINLMSAGKIVGSVTIHIQDPDSLAFTSDELNLNYGEQSDLGLVARYQGEPVNLKDGDIVWTLSDNAIGAFQGNIFVATEDKKVSASAQITAAYKEFTDSITVNVGKQPSIVMDGGDEDVWDYSNIGTTVESFEGLAPDAVATYHYAGRGGVVKGSVVSDTDPEYADIVRFGHNAIRLDFDWSGLTGTDGACLGLGQAMDITGTPTAIGVWVYIPEGVPVPWLRAQIATSSDGNTWTNAFINFNSGEANGNGMQTGWQYLEADLTQYAGQMIRINSGMLFRAMAGNAPGFGWYTTDDILLDKSQLKGYIILDNIQFVYGANNQDVTNPSVDSISLINDDGTMTELENGAIVSDNTLSFFATYNDHEDTDDFATGIESAYFYLDGIYYGAGNQDSLGSTLAGITMADGAHSLTMYIKDSFGNVTRETRYFTVQGGGAFTNMELRANGAPTVGREWKLSLVSNNPADVKTAETAINISSNFPVVDVSFAPGVTGSYTYNELRGVLTVTISAVNTPAIMGNALAEITVDVPASTVQDSSIGVQVTSGTYDTVTPPVLEEGSQDFWGGFSTPIAMYAVDAYYELQAPTLVVGMDAVISATHNGEPVSNLNIYYNNGKVLGNTNTLGQVDASALTGEAGIYTLYAQDDSGNLSYPLTVSSNNAIGDESGAPYYILSNVTDAAVTKKNISWMSNPLTSANTAQVKVSTAADMSGASVVSGTSDIVAYSSSMAANRVNSAVITGLKPGTTYYYQVGDGTCWSEVKCFTTADADEEQTDIFMIADIQEDDAITGFGNIAKLLQQGDYDLGIQTGDAVDNVRYYNQWEDTLNLFSMDGIAQTDILHVVGNHEADDDGYGGAATKKIFNIEADWYSVEYGDVYIAVLNHTSDREKLAEFGEWLVEDAAKSDCAWKIMTTHVPIYYTNPTGGGEIYNEMLPAAIEQAGIDMVFAGNDHSYARTAPLTNGSVDANNGVVYYICGSTGGKSYSIVDNPEFHFDIATIDFNSVYMTLSATPSKVTVTAYNVDANGNASILDTYTKSKQPCVNDEHTYIYDRSTDRLECSVCGERSYAKEDEYSGWATDVETGRAMYFVGGDAVLGEVKLDDGVIYYFDQNGLALSGEIQVCGETCTFENGAFVGSSNQDVRFAGYVGTNIQWVMYYDGLLKVSGSGDMKDYKIRGGAPWSEYRHDITRIEIGKDITSIGVYAFYGAINCECVTFEEGSKVTDIGGSAFYYFSDLREIRLPDGVKTIGNYSFGYGGKLEKVYLPDGVSFINDTAFNSCDLDLLILNVLEDSYAESYARRKGIQYETRKPEQKPIQSGTCGVNITWEMYPDGLMKLTGSGDMTDYKNFRDTPWYNFRYDIKAIEIGKDITSIGVYAFFGAINCERVTFEEGSKLSDIGGSAFYYLSSLKEITVPDHVTSIGNYSFGYDTKLEQVYLPAGISFINDTAFNSCDWGRLVLHVLEDSYAEQYAVDKGILYETYSRPASSGMCGENVQWAFYENGLLRLTGSGDMTDYKNYRDTPWYDFRYDIKSIEIDKNITSIGVYAFFGAMNCESIIFEPGSQLTDIGGSAFYYFSSLKEITIPDTVRTIGNYAFGYATQLEKVYIPDRMYAINDTAFNSCDWDKLVLNVLSGSKAEEYAQQKGIRYESREPLPEPIYSGTCGENVEWALYDGGVLKLTGWGRMSDYKNFRDAPWYDFRYDIKAIEIGKDITSVGVHAFFGAMNCEYVTFETGSKLTSVGGSAFYYLSSLKEIMLPEAVRTIGNAAFGYCGQLEKIYLPDYVSSINDTAFLACDQSKLVLNVATGSYAEQYAKDKGLQHTVRKA